VLRRKQPSREAEKKKKYRLQPISYITRGDGRLELPSVGRGEEKKINQRLGKRELLALQKD